MQIRPFLAISIGSLFFIFSLLLLPACLALSPGNQTTPPLSASPLNDSSNNHTHPSASNPAPAPIETGTYSSASSLFPATSSANSKFIPCIPIIVGVMLGSFTIMGIFFAYIHRCTSHDQLHHRNINRNLAFQSAVRQHLQSLETACSPHGLDLELVNSLPTRKFSKAMEIKESPEAAKAKRIVVECVVCLMEFEEDEVLRFLPKCGHYFHVDCIDMWLFSHATCPLCRCCLLCEGKKDEAESRDVNVPLTAIVVQQHFQ